MTREQYRVEAEKLGIVAGPVDPDAEDFNELLADDVIAIAVKSDMYEAFDEKYVL